MDYGSPVVEYESPKSPLHTLMIYDLRSLMSDSELTLTNSSSADDTDDADLFSRCHSERSLRSEESVNVSISNRNQIFRYAQNDRDSTTSLNH